MYKLIFYVPQSHLQKVKDALFEAGAGKIGAYEKCCWQTKGQGQFVALEGAHAAFGEKGSLTRVEEYKVETCCPDHLIKPLIKLLKEVHPYEMPFYDVWKLEDL